jgi:muconolactone delta-isomerase
MKFLIITRNRGTSAVPPAAMPALIEATKAFITRGRNAGKWDVVYSHTSGGVAIANHDTHEDLNAWLAEYPMAPFQEIEVLPLADVDQSLDKLLQTARQVASMIGGGR